MRILKPHSWSGGQKQSLFSRCHVPASKPEMAFILRTTMTCPRWLHLWQEIYTHIQLFLVLCLFPPFYPKLFENPIKYYCWLIFSPYLPIIITILSFYLSCFNYCYYSLIFLSITLRIDFFYVHYNQLLIACWLFLNFNFILQKKNCVWRYALITKSTGLNLCNCFLKCL